MEVEVEVEGLSLFNVYPEKSPVVSFGLLKYCGRKSKETYCDWSGEERRREVAPPSLRDCSGPTEILPSDQPRL